MNFQMFRIKPNDHHCGITRSGNYIPATVGFLDPPERLFNLKGEMTYDVPECIWRKAYLMTGWMILDSEIISLAERTLFMANMQKIIMKT